MITKVYKMIYFAYADLSSLIKEETDKKTREWLLHIEAHRLLADFYRMIRGAALPTLKKDERGRPYLLGKGVPFLSLTHEGNAAAVAISDSPVGVDLTLRGRAATERACRRFLRDMRESGRADPSCVRCFRARYREGAAYEPTPFLPLFKEEDGYAARFARAEACLKLSGGGFADLPKISEISERADVLFFSLPAPLSSYEAVIATERLSE